MQYYFLELIFAPLLFSGVDTGILERVGAED